MTNGAYCDIISEIRLEVNFLENRYYDVVIAELQPFFDENGFKFKEDAFVSETKALKVEYDEEKQLYKLLCADIAEEGIKEYSVISSYLFDEGQTKNDAVSVGIDFVDTARKAMGIKANRKTVSGEAELPSAKGDKVTVGTLTAKLLANYPELKDTYKEQTAAKGKYLYLDFCTTYFVPEIKKTLGSGNKKAIKKLVDMLCEMFVTGDRATVNLVIALLSAAVGTDVELFKAAANRMEACPHLIASVNNEVAVLVKDKKLQKALKFQG